MNRLATENLKPVGVAAKRLGHTEIVDLLQHLPSWRLVATDDVERLEKIFEFKNFADALAFTVQVGRLADEVDHHPTILTAWGKTTVTWWTHSLQGLHRNDFIMAAKTEALYA